jgi:hypothetical protein
VVSRSAWIDTYQLTNESQIPGKPTVTYTGPAGHPGNVLAFQTSAYSSVYSPFGAIEWRIAEVSPAGGADFDPADPKKYEIEAAWESGELTTFSPTVTIPSSSVRAGNTYRVRVRMRDTQGRYGHWSNPVEFVVGPRAGGYVDSVRVTEIMYSPGALTPADMAAGFTTKEDFEYVEIQNIGDHALDFGGLQFSDGITYAIPAVNVGAGQYLVVARNPAAFQFRYPGIACVGPYGGSLNNAGENLLFEDPLSGVIQAFEFKGGWFDHADGGGFSIVIRNPAESSSLWSIKDGWKASWQSGGNPGAADTGLSPGDVVIN